MIVSWYLQKNGEDDYVGDDPDYIVTDVPEKYVTYSDTNRSNENDDGYDVGIEDYDEDVDNDDDGIHCCYYWDWGCFFLSPYY